MVTEHDLDPAREISTMSVSIEYSGRNAREHASTLNFINASTSSGVGEFGAAPFALQ
jgi:hypothetical protein